VKDESFDSIVFLERKELLACDGWSPPARQTLETAPEDVNLAEVVDQYPDAVVEFNTWFGEAFVGGHLEAFDDVRDLKQQLAVLYWEGGAVE
jgi:hypothetical protein